jgi:hypothetical protein
MALPSVRVCQDQDHIGRDFEGCHRHHQIQYHLHFGLLVSHVDWNVAVNLGTDDDDDDLLKFKLVYDFRRSGYEARDKSRARRSAIRSIERAAALNRNG